MAVVALLGEVPKPPIVNAAWIRALRHPADESGPCEEGLANALLWIGERELPFDLALSEARSALDPEWLRWATEAIGSGYGSGYGYGDGSGYGYGSGDGSGYGYGSGYGSGYGDGGGSGGGSGYGYGYGSGDGSGYGYGYGYGDGSGYEASNV